MFTKDQWHWLRHLWTNWEPYEVRYKKGARDVRQRRYCVMCGFLEDELVAADARLPPSSVPHAEVAFEKGVEA